MQPFRIRSNDKITQGFTHAELDFAFYCSPPPGFSDICYPELKLSKNEARPRVCSKLPFPPRQSESLKSLEIVELSECTVFDSMIPSIHSPLHNLFYLIGVKTYSHLLSIP